MSRSRLNQIKRLSECINKKSKYWNDYSYLEQKFLVLTTIFKLLGMDEPEAKKTAKKILRQAVIKMQEETI